MAQAPALAVETHVQIGMELLDQLLPDGRPLAEHVLKAVKGTPSQSRLKAVEDRRLCHQG